MAFAATSLYLSRLVLNPQSRQVMSEITQPYEMHRTLMRAFPRMADDSQRKARDEFSVLFRAEVADLQGPVKVYVQSCIEPDWSFLHDLNDYLWANAGGPAYEWKDVLQAYRQIQGGQVLSFRLRANPTKRIAAENNKLKGKRVELRREDEQLSWLSRKGQTMDNGVPGGFSLLMKKVKDGTGEEYMVPCVKVCCEGKQVGRKRDEAGGHPTTHMAVLFDGLLRVTDAASFLETLINGIGAGKAFGFGLLSVASVASYALKEEG